MLLLHPLPTCTDAGPDLCTNFLTFAPCALTFASCACGVIILSTSASTPLAHMLAATCAGAVFSSTHWCTYSICTRATCTVWWWSVVVVVVCGCGGGGCSYGVVVVVQWHWLVR